MYFLESFIGDGDWRCGPTWKGLFWVRKDEPGFWVFWIANLSWRFLDGILGFSRSLRILISLFLRLLSNFLPKFNICHSNHFLVCFFIELYDHPPSLIYIIMLSPNSIIVNFTEFLYRSPSQHSIIVIAHRFVLLLFLIEFFHRPLATIRLLTRRAPPAFSKTLSHLFFFFFVTHRIPFSFAFTEFRYHPPSPIYTITRPITYIVQQN
jgi:hypothetical protein